MRLALVIPEGVSLNIPKQLGVTDVVAGLPRGPQGPVSDFLPLLHQKMKFADAGLTWSVIESFSPTDRVKLGLPGRDEDIEKYCQGLRNLGAAGIPIVCYNFMAVIGPFRASTTTPTRGGALVTSFDYDLVKDAPLTEAGEVSDEQMWDNFAYFLKRVIPVAEEAKVKMALHPDDPPIPRLRGLARIFRSVEAFDRVLKMVPSEYNGLTFCQGCFSEMDVDIPQTIRHFGKKIFFVHFRDVRGNAFRFEETFHDDGKTDMLEAMRTYKEIGFTGPMRPDHVPTMEGDEGGRAGYTLRGRLFAIGYMKALMEAVGATPPKRGR